MEWEVQLKRLSQAEKILGTMFEFTSNKEATPVAPAHAPVMKKGKDGQQYIDFEKENQILNK
jgi:hypothetical protein